MLKGKAHVVVVIDATAPIAPVLELARRFCPEPAHLHVVAIDGALARPELEQALENPGFEYSLEESFDAAQVALATHGEASLVVVGPWPSRSSLARSLAVLQWVARYGVNVLSVGARCEVRPSPVGAERPSTKAEVCVALDPGSSALPETAAAVRELRGVQKVTLLLRGRLADSAERTIRALFPTHELELLELGEVEPTALAEGAHARHAELLVVPSADVRASTLMSSIFSERTLDDAPLPVLLLHHDATGTGLFAARLSATDTFRLRGPSLRVLVERSSTLGRASLPESETFFLVGAEARGPLAHVSGVVEIPRAWVPEHATAIALCSTGAPVPVASISVLGDRPVVLLDARYPLEALADVEPFALEHSIVVVRLRAEQPLETLRAQFDGAAPWGGPVAVLDASAFLDDGGAGDVSELVDGVRLQRVGLALLSQGAPVVALITASVPAPVSPLLKSWTMATLRARSPTAALSAPPVEVPDEETRWRLCVGAPLVEGHHVTLELENEAARRGLLEAIASARERVHWQSYMVDDDAVSEEVADALRVAAARGVKVRVLVDALYSLHGAYGIRNPVLQRLGAAPNVEVLASQPLSGLPHVIDLKQRNHRKLCTFDRRLATVSGRNLGAPYYRGFKELALTASTSFHDVPWLDAGVRFEGPLVEAVDRSFLNDWVRAGGSEFEVSPAPPAGTMACRLVLHQGLHDANTLEMQLELIRSAKTRLVFVNTFPLVVELQRALVGAVKRGVRVQCLFGSVRPRWGDDQPFGRGALRALADELVRARISPVLRAGAEGFQYTVDAAGLGPVFTHVHAKLLVRDEDAVAVGSANADATSAYWESEAVLLVHDPGFAKSVLAELEPLLSTARPVDLRTAGWKEVEARREWLSRNWPTLFP